MLYGVEATVQITSKSEELYYHQRKKQELDIRTFKSNFTHLPIRKLTETRKFKPWAKRRRCWFKT